MCRHGRNGVTGGIDGKTVGIGNRDFVTAMGVEIAPQTAHMIEGISREGQTVLYATVKGDAEPELASVLVLQDGLKAESVDVISRLRRLGVTPVLLTGDKGGPVTSVAADVGIKAKDVHAGFFQVTRRTFSSRRAFQPVRLQRTRRRRCCQQPEPRVNEGRLPSALSAMASTTWRPSPQPT